MVWVVILSVTALVFMLVGFLLAFFWVVPHLEQYMVFRPSTVVRATPAQIGIPFDQHFIPTEDGCRLSAWHMCPPQPIGSIIYFHGNGGNLGILNEVFRLLYNARFQVLAVDYRGYGWSDGRPTEEGLHWDAEATVSYFESHLQTPDLPVLFWGRSLGGWVAAYAARRFNPDGLVLEAAFSSKRSLMKYYPQFRIFSIFSRYRLDTLRHLDGHLFPILLLHGDRDKTVPFEEGQSLFEKLSEPKKFYCIPGADHIDLHRRDENAYMAEVLGFVDGLKASTVH